MIIVQTPLRISFAGGGTDFSGYYRREGGCVVSTAIDKYIYVIIKERFDSNIRIGYSRTELVDKVEDIEHELVREAMKKVDVRYGIEIATMADIPSEGSGLGSSSSVTVALLHALYTFKGQLVTPGQLAREACEIEIEILGKPIGKQDQYIAAYGGLRRINFRADDTVAVDWIPMPEEQKRRFSESLMLFYTGITRKADKILAEQKDNIAEKLVTLDKMREQADEVYEALVDGNLNRIGRVMDAGWRHKKQLATTISNTHINAYYEAALDAGAIGGKVAGAGGGGFLLLFCPPDRQAAVRHALSSLRELPINLERDGTKVILNARR
ncbi:GHMP kinase [Armatimonas rosea]|uniref:D-glycero-alpha-D-manno-heptose-7-phosphate kinase n=1 Tax=Armatimonas rosea TaxID=685828 RepID=A0A7W9SPR1_ARMRO|nr:GHMP kinase [Armatimonas rosea]MBB6049739.1 D-glycero-alpha-D-manno-heptose-7-phosphate kinase [Armatimonas rosea]